MKAAIVGLVRGYPEIIRYSKLISRNKLIHKNFNRHYNYPVIIFHEGNILESHQKVISKLTPNISFVDISATAFILPPGFTGDPNKVHGYHHMCRFNAMQLYDFVKDFDYILRLDDDSFLESHIDYDIFSFMKQRNLIYGYIHKEEEYHQKTVETLPLFTRNYIEKNNIKIKCSLNEIDAVYYYSNFAITNVAFWHKPEVQAYLHAVDESNGIYEFRWGDALIQALAVKMFCDPQQAHHFQDFRYIHESHDWANFQRGSKNGFLEKYQNRIQKYLQKIYLEYLLKRLN